MSFLQTCTPLNGNVVVRVVVPEGEGTNSVILRPDTVATYPTEGEVVAVSRGYRTAEGVLVEPEVSVGDRVFYAYKSIKWNENPGGSGGNYSLENGSLFVIHQSDILAKGN